MRRECDGRQASRDGWCCRCRGNRRDECVAGRRAAVRSLWRAAAQAPGSQCGTAARFTCPPARTGDLAGHSGCTSRIRRRRRRFVCNCFAPVHRCPRVRLRPRRVGGVIRRLDPGGRSPSAATPGQSAPGVDDASGPCRLRRCTGCDRAALESAHVSRPRRPTQGTGTTSSRSGGRWCRRPARCE
jgi:hypothetical protein